MMQVTVPEEFVQPSGRETTLTPTGRTALVVTFEAGDGPKLLMTAV
jgi:hypothetical protein